MIGAILLAPALCVPGTAAHRAGVFWRCLIAAPGLKVRARAASSLQALLAAAGMAPGRFQVTPPRVHAGAGLPSHQRKHLWSFDEARREAPGSTFRATVPCSRLRTRFNEARRETPGSRERRGFSVRGSVDASMRPGANAGINPSGNSAPDYGLASMMPDANRRDHKRYSAATFPWDQLGFNEARREAPGSRERRGFSVRGSVDASMRPGANCRDHVNRRDHPWAQGVLASMRPGAKRRDHGPDTGCPHHKQLSSTLRALAERPRCNT